MLKEQVLYFADEASVEQLSLNDFAVDMPSERIFKDSGAMIAPCTIARTGIMQYKAKECGALFADRDPESIVKIATTEAELFAKDSLESYRAAPITVGHPTEQVSTDNAKELSVGHLESIPVADGNMISSHIVINDADAIKLVESGTSQLSSGHTCKLVLADEDAEYDAYKADIRANHVAIVESGRAGSAKIADEESVDADEKLPFEEKQDEVTKGAEEAKVYDQDYVDTLQAKIDGLEAKLADAKDKAQLQDKAIEEAQLSDEKIFSLVQERMEFVQACATLSDMDVSKLSTMDAKRAIVSELMDKDLEDKSDVYIEARFDIALEDADTSSPMAKELQKQATVVVASDAETYVSPAEQARLKMIKRTTKG